MEGVRKILVHSIQNHYPFELSDYERIMNDHGTAATAAFALPPHANEVLKLFWECEVKQCLPVAFYEAVVRGVNSLSSPSPKVSLPPQILGPAIRALGSFHNRRAEHVRYALDSASECERCTYGNLPFVEHLLLPAKNDLSISPLRSASLKPDIARLFCGPCAEAVTDESRAFRSMFWEELPALCGLSVWKELLRSVVLK